MAGHRERLDEVEISRRVAQSEWARDGESIQRTFRFETFRDALAFVNAVGELAEQRDHHPDIDIRWNRVRLRLSTHSAGGLTGMDFDLAQAIDRLEP
jgi:4a-hydroxytetrahydrobiopterin dehydratase